MAGPVVTDESELGAMGVRIVDAIVHDNLRHIFRPRERRDLGIDGEIELVEEISANRQGSGRLVAVQIKCGKSYFREQDEEAITYRGDLKHLAYWSGFSIPVIIVLCHPETREAYWTEFDPATLTVLKSGWKTRVPRANLLQHSEFAIRTIAERNHLLEVIDLSIQAWFHAVNAERVEFCGIFQLPRDYHWYRHLVQVGDHSVMLHWIHARYGRFDPDELRDVLRHLPGNIYYAPKLVLCFVAESIDLLELDTELTELLAGHDEIEIRRLLFKRKESLVGEVRDDGGIDIEYYNAAPVYRENARGEWIS